MNQKGRSMVEMLGVLAIIGVLSAGGLAGYSKAMFQYKLNKQRDQYTQILRGIIEYKSLIKEIPGAARRLEAYKKLNIIPPEMIKDESQYIYDIFGYKIQFYNSYWNIVFNEKGISSEKICINIFQIFKELPTDLGAVGVNSTNSEDINQQQWFFSDDSASCRNGGGRCIRNMTIRDMHNMCSKCDSHSCGIYAIIKN